LREWRPPAAAHDDSALYSQSKASQQSPAMKPTRPRRGDSFRWDCEASVEGGGGWGMSVCVFVFVRVCLIFVVCFVYTICIVFDKWTMFVNCYCLLTSRSVCIIMFILYCLYSMLCMIVVWWYTVWPPQKQTSMGWGWGMGVGGDCKFLSVVPKTKRKRAWYCFEESTPWWCLLSVTKSNLFCLSPSFSCDLANQGCFLIRDVLCFDCCEPQTTNIVSTVFLLHSYRLLRLTLFCVLVVLWPFPFWTVFLKKEVVCL
jgi:hypothetical protein